MSNFLVKSEYDFHLSEFLIFSLIFFKLFITHKLLRNNIKKQFSSIFTTTVGMLYVNRMKKNVALIFQRIKNIVAKHN